ncbi:MULTISPECIES: hypothetical protein [Planktothrix]|uniref:hypothetical protein n=1 Tax=Planktothrix TaxID=54304 RepID=UPI000408A613|nr:MULTISPECIES: hypothetical protein [Planktothrix]CAD5924000.1 hypothetical protein NO758_00845 [Planktothrix agardhii]
MTWLVKVDHITYACASGMIEKWAWFHTEVEGGKLIKRIDDIDPHNPNSSMKLWCIDYGSFGIALIEGIDRKEKSQVTLFTELHQDHSIQHVAYETKNLEQFQERLANYKCDILGEPITKTDAWGIVKQLFCRGYSPTTPAKTTFAEYVERPKNTNSDSKITFSQEAGKGFYNQIEAAIAQEKYQAFTEFSAMPENWEPPKISEPESTRISNQSAGK